MGGRKKSRDNRKKLTNSHTTSTTPQKSSKSTSTTTKPIPISSNTSNTTKSLSDAMEDTLFVSNDPTNNNNDNNNNAAVTSASYPIPGTLARLLKEAIIGSSTNDDVNKKDTIEITGNVHNKNDNEEHEEEQANNKPKLVVEVESLEEGLKNLMGNAFHALDSMYFSTPGEIRTKSTFAHRQCIRISTSADEGTLAITDYGSGMTRADLINSLGVGRSLSNRAKMASNYLASIYTDRDSNDMSIGDDEDEHDDKDVSNDNSDSNTDDSNHDYSNEDEDDEESNSESDDQDDESDFDDDAYQNSQDDMNSSSKTSLTGPISIPCKKNDIGGFYSTFCALGTSVQVCTKSKFDDYYEFQVISTPTSSDENDNFNNNNFNINENNFEKFTITRPLGEGTRPTVHNGFTDFADVRGDSGTKVVIKLNSKAISAGLLEEQTILKPLMRKIMETSQYSVAFSTDDTESVNAIIQASEDEDKDNEARRRANDNNSDEEVDTSVDGNHRVASNYNTVLERAKYIPLRLSLGERKILRLMEATMACADYTTIVDNYAFKSKARRTHAQLKAITAVLRGMVSACDYNAGQKLIQDGNYMEYQEFFRSTFEIARRHKIMNPEKMRTEYGKLIYLLQDAVSPSIQPHLGFSVKGPILTVFKFLEDRDGLALLKDNYIELATQEVLAEKKSRSKINSEIKRKEKAVAHLKAKYRTMKLTSEDIHLCLYSICDNNSFLNSNRVPIDKVIKYLQTFFEPSKIQKGYSLSIISGQDGARLSHNHERQYYFALQSLTLWRDIVDDMFHLWHMEEEDLLSDSVTYTLQDTGQGMQRIQQSPRTYKAMQRILDRVKRRVNIWIGSSVIHLGDHNVPNALSFIDKYTQVPRILGPIVVCLENLERICDEDDGIKDYVKVTFGGLERVKKDILFDFFRSAFDGSGADNFYDAGSCIDGRLTSAWNWCSQLPAKKYFTIFKLTGFIGFDGEFK